MKKEIIKDNLIYFVLLAAIILESFDCFYISDNVITDIGVSEAARKNIVLTGYKDETIPTEDEIFVGKSNKEIFDYYVKKQKYIMHAGGSIEGYNYTNSYDALDYNYKAGNRIFEIDLNYTSDKHLVLIHGWEEKDYKYKLGLSYNKNNAIMNYDTFKNVLIRNKYQTMSVEDLISFMRTHPYSYFILNLKNGSKVNITKDGLSKVVSAARYDKNVLNRLVIWGYNEKVIKTAKSIYNFELITYSYSNPKNSAKINAQVIKFCKENNISSLVYSMDSFNSTIANLANKNGIYSFVFTTDNKNVAENLIKKGATMVMSNTLKN